VTISVQIHDLRALLHWAAIGVSMNTCGSYADAAEEPHDSGIINEYANRIHFSVSVRPVFKVDNG